MANEKNLVEQEIADNVIQDQAEKGIANGYPGLDALIRVVQSPKLHHSAHIIGGDDAFSNLDDINVGKLKTGLTTERYTKTITTLDATPVDLEAITVAEEEVVDAEVIVVARKSDGTQRAIYHLEGVFYRNTAGNVTQQGNTASLFIRRSTSAYDVNLEADTTNQTVDVRVTGVAATTIKWEARIAVTRLQA